MPAILAAFGFLKLHKKMVGWIALVIAALLLVGAGVYLVRDWKKNIETAAYMRGQVDEHTRQENLAREIEKALSNRLDKIDERAGDQITEQKEKETKYVERIIKEISADPVYSECRVSDSVLDARNEIRRSLNAPSDSETGASAGEEGNPAS